MAKARRGWTRASRCAVLALLLWVIAPLGAVPSFAQTTALKIMPLGASLTDGYDFPGGYRIDLEDDLIASGVTPDYVGSLSNGPAALADKNHEGHSGYRIDQIRASIDTWIGTYQPDVVLLLVGTNDMLQDFQLATAPDRLAALVDRIHALRPTTKILVSSLPPLANAADNSQASTYNAAMPAMVDARAAAGKPIWFVDGNGSVTVSDLIADGIHLTAAGYSKLADAWHRVLMTALGRPTASITAPGAGSVFPFGEDVLLSASASDPDGGLARVEFFAGSTKLGEDVSAPYEWLWVDPPAGTHSLTARAVDAAGAAGVSSAVSITVDPPAGELAFYRAVDVGGAGVVIDGRAWEPTSAPNLRVGPKLFQNQSIALVPATDSARASMIRSSAWGSTLTEVSLLSVPAGTYEVYVTVWEDNFSATFDVRLEGAVVRAGYRSGSAGTWARLGPFRAAVTDGSLDVTAGPDAIISGIEVWRVN